MQGEKFLVIGTDKKMQSCKNRLVQLGCESRCCDVQELEILLPQYENIVLPLPTLANGTIAGTGKTQTEFAGMLKENQRVFYGNLSLPSFPCSALSYYYNESFLIKNSRLTAQGALKIILDEISTDLRSLSVAVIGYGRCGSAICRLLSACGAVVTAFSRSSGAKARAENDGIRVIDCSDVNRLLHKFDVTVNTVPYNIINETALSRLTRKNIYIEIASRPYGFDIGKNDKYNFRYILAESLPGKLTPAGAGVNIADTVLELI